LDSMEAKHDLEKRRRLSLEKQVASQENTIRELQQMLQRKRKQEEETEGEELVQRYGVIPAALFKRIRLSNQEGPSRRPYPPELRAFAVTLHYHSPSGYSYARDTFHRELPDPRTIVRWYGNLRCDPGFTQQAFDVLKQKAEAQGSPLHVALSLDEMSIRKQVVWSGKAFVGFRDMGDGIELEDRPLAKDALVFLVVNLKEKWKLTVAYFLIAGISGKELARLVTIALEKLYDVGVIVSCITCDGPTSHFTMFSELGAQLDVHEMTPWFPHPSNKNLRVCTMFDPCHMLKLARNCFATAGCLIDDTGAKVQYKYIEELFKIQEDEGLRLGNRLKKRHRLWFKMKMKVGIAAQLLSASTADTLDFLREDLKLPQFQGSEATSRFLRVFNSLFDLCNSKNPFAPGCKASLKKETREHWEAVMRSTYDYLVMLTDEFGTPLYATKKKTAFVGFCTVLHSLIAIFEDLVEAGHLDFLNTYKLLQDHIELYFGLVRLRFGSNNNPNAVQFMASYKRLLVHHEINSHTFQGNCVPTDTLRMLSISSAQKKTEEFLDPFDNTFLKDFDLEERAPTVCDHDYVDAPAISQLSAFKEAAVTYMAGYVVRMVLKLVKCDTCKLALFSKERRFSSLTSPQLLQRKDRGGLMVPSEEVEFVCHQAELIFSQILKVKKGLVPQAAMLQLKVSIAVVQKSFEKRQ